jgi:sterol O-acyltransferase
MFLMAVRIYVRSLEASGKPMNLEFAMKYMFSEDTVIMFVSDGILVLSTVLCVPFAKAVANGWISYYPTGTIIQHLWQTSVLFVAIKWAFHRHWPWVQSGYLTLHTLVMIMKMHSYMNINGYLSYINQQANDVLGQLRRETAKVGGWDEAVAAAESHRRERERAASSPTDDSPTNDGPTMDDAATTATTLRKRANTSKPSASDALAPAADVNPDQVVTTGNRVLSPADVLKPAPHPLVDHPDEYIASLVKEYSELESELISTGPEYIRWPNNISYKNFATYMLIPTLVYELEYPRTDRSVEVELI